MFPLLQSTAGQKVPVIMKDAAGAVITGMVTPTITISKNCGSLGAVSDGTWAELAGGLYSVQLNDTDTNTVGPLVVRVVKAGAVDSFICCSVRATTEAAVGLANDAITAAKFDESTAYPLKSADTGATAVARVGADSDTLETLSDQIDGAATAVNLATVAGYLDTEISAILEDTGTTLPAQITALNNLSSTAAQAACAAALTAYGGPTNAQMEARTLAAAAYATAAALASAATDITLLRKLKQNRLEIDLTTSKAYIWNDAGAAREYSSTLTDKDGAAVTQNTTGPINSTRWTAV